jgi:D-glycero-D-manno-heptose 1,7-bisphosphate phosphatase
VRRAVFLDRDGTLIEEVGYLDRLDRLRFYPFSIDAVRLLNRAGFAVVVVTNQSGVARGLFDDAFVRDTHRLIAETLAAGGTRVEGFYYCPHHPEATVPSYRQACECRKPKPGLLRLATAELDLDSSRSFAIGDSWKDLEAGAAVGATGVLVRTGYGRRDEVTASTANAVVTDNLIEAVSWILRQP